MLGLQLGETPAASNETFCSLMQSRSLLLDSWHGKYLNRHTVWKLNHVSYVTILDTLVKLR